MALTLKLPMLNMSGQAWHLTAACRALDPEMFFSPDDERGPRKRQRDATAKAVCASCPVKRKCFEWALAVHEPYGIWGGATASERASLSKPAAA
jgi:WhiB family redox-sensing transcriptional regulator